MSAQYLVRNSKRSASLTAILATTFVVLAATSLLVAGIFQIVSYFWSQEKLVASEQEIIALDAAQEVSNFIQQIFTTLDAAAQVSSPFSNPAEEQKLILGKLLGLEPALREVTLLDHEGQAVAKLSRVSIVAETDLTNQADSELFTQTIKGQRYFSTVHVDETTNEPLMSIAIPVKNLFGDVEGVLAAEVNLKFMWDLVGSLEVGQTGQAYVVDRQGNLLAIGDTSRVLRGENVSHLPEVAEFVHRDDATLELEETNRPISTGIDGDNVLASYYPLGTPDWAVVVELPIEEAYYTTGVNLALSVAIVLTVALLAGIAGIYMARRIGAPIRHLTETATRIAEGQIELTAPIEGPTEVTVLAKAFNSMTAQLQELIGSLEQRVADRTRRLELAATLAEQMSSILNLNQLLVEVVNQVKDKFGYYHTHIYLLDDKQEKLVVAEGSGQAGAEMKAREHSIPLNTTNSLVANAARSGQIIKVDNVRESPDWLPNPLLPDTRSEMAVPIILEGHIVGVLDVQEDKVAGFDEADANLLLTLTSQVAVAIRNARLFTEVEEALAAVRVTQERYYEQGWAKVRHQKRGAQYLHQRADAAQLESHLISRLEQETEAQNQITVVHTNETMGHEDAAVVAPIKLQNQLIGTIQLHKTEKQSNWSDRELALIEAVANQVAQTAENLRLFEEIRQRAGREQTIREITEKMRTAANLEQLIKTTAHELGQRLAVGHAVVELGIESQMHNAGPAQNLSDNENGIHHNSL